METRYDPFTSWFCFITGLSSTVGLLLGAIYAIAVDPSYVKPSHHHPSMDEVLTSALLFLSACLGALITLATGKVILRHSSELHQNQPEVVK